MKRWLAGLALILTSVACSGGGNSGGGGGPTQPPSGIAFSANGGPDSNAIVVIEAFGTTASTLRLDISAQGMTDLYGVAFDFVYPSELVTFSSSNAGGFLAGTSTSYQVREVSPGRLVVGASRVGAVAGASGSGVVYTFEFASRNVAGSGAIGFERNTAFNSSGGGIAGTTWSGGSLTVTP